MAIDFSTPQSTGKSQGSNQSSGQNSGQNSKKQNGFNISTASLFASLKPKVTSKDRKFFTEQLALLIETGNTLHGSLEILQKQATHSELEQLIADLYEKVTKGQTFAQALSLHKELFSPTYITLVAAGENGGYLATVLQHLLEMEEKREELRSMVISAFFYPVILIVFSILIVVFMLTSIFPKFTEMFTSAGLKLPPVTQVLMSASDFMLQYWWVLLGALAALVGYLITLIKRPESKSKLDLQMLVAPLIGGLFVRIYMTHMMRLLSLSLQNGVTLIDALTICKDATGNGAFQRFVEKLVTNVSEGRGLGVGFKETKFVPQLVQQMIQTGEDSGKLPLVTGRLADYYQRELARKLALLAKIIEPAMLLAMGVFVAFIVSALVLPIFKISSGVQ